MPKPVNLPSLKKVRDRHPCGSTRCLVAGAALTFATLLLQENAGNDPSTQIVPTGGGWTKPEEAYAPHTDARHPTAAITPGSTWGGAPIRHAAAAPWLPPEVAPPVYRPPVAPGRLNPAEYPTLSAAAQAKLAQQQLKPQPTLSHSFGQVRLLSSCLSGLLITLCFAGKSTDVWLPSTLR